MTSVKPIVGYKGRRFRGVNTTPPNQLFNHDQRINWMLLGTRLVDCCCTYDSRAKAEGRRTGGRATLMVASTATGALAFFFYILKAHRIYIWLSVYSSLHSAVHPFDHHAPSTCSTRLYTNGIYIYKVYYIIKCTFIYIYNNA